MRIGIHNPYLGALGGGDKYVFTILEQALREGDEAVVFAPPQPPPERWREVGVDVDAGAFELAAPDRALVTERSRELDLLVTLTTGVPVLNHAARGVAVVQFPFVAHERPARRARAAVLRFAGRARAPDALASYGRYVCYSRFARDWTARRLGVEARVIAPPIDPPGPPAAKAAQILSVGRFFRGAHDKRHDIAIKAFGQLRSQDPAATDWELHVVGTADAGAAARRLLADLRSLAAGLPVTFHVNAPRTELADLYASGAMLWHAAGYGVRPDRHPERLEHFGIVVAEAMANGAVPLVVGLGGPAEIVDDGRTGCHWRTVDELVAATRELIRRPERAEAMRVAGREHATRFEKARFMETVSSEVLAA